MTARSDKGGEGRTLGSDLTEEKHEDTQMRKLTAIITAVGLLGATSLTPVLAQTPAPAPAPAPAAAPAPAPMAAPAKAPVKKAGKKAAKKPAKKMAKKPAKKMGKKPAKKPMAPKPAEKSSAIFYRIAA